MTTISVVHYKEPSAAFIFSHNALLFILPRTYDVYWCTTSALMKQSRYKWIINYKHPINVYQQLSGGGFLLMCLFKHSCKKIICFSNFVSYLQFKKGFLKHKKNPLYQKCYFLALLRHYITMLQQSTWFKATTSTPHSVYLWFLPKQPQLVLGSAHGVFWVGSWPRGPIFVSVSFGCVADGPVWTRSAQVLAEVLEGEVARRFKAGLKRLHDNAWILGRRKTDGRVSGGKQKEGRRYRAGQNKFACQHPAFVSSLSPSPPLSYVTAHIFITVFWGWRQ